MLIIKPDAIRRELEGKIRARLRGAGFTEIQTARYCMSDRQARDFYRKHEGESWFEELIAHMTSGTSVFLHLAGENVRSEVQKLIGAPDPAKAEPETIRGDLRDETSDTLRNMVDASDSREACNREYRLAFLTCN